MKVAQSCLTLFDPMDYPVHAILETRILEWVAVTFSKRSSQPRDRTLDLPCSRQILYHRSHQGRTQVRLALGSLLVRASGVL